MTAATPRTVKTRSGNRKAVALDANTFEIVHCRIEAPRLGVIKVDEKMGDPWFYPESALYHADQLRDVVYLMDRVGRKVK